MHKKRRDRAETLNWSNRLMLVCASGRGLHCRRLRQSGNQTIGHCRCHRDRIGRNRCSECCFVRRRVGRVRRFGKSIKSRTLLSVAAFAAAFAVTAAPVADARQKTVRAPAAEAEFQSRPDSPLIIVVSIRKQKVRVYDANGEITSSRISSGRPGFATPTGVFSILEKNVTTEATSIPALRCPTWSASPGPA